MARRLCLDERARIEAMAQAGLGAARIARRLGRHRTTVQRELGRGGPGGYDAEAAQAAACIRAARPRAPKLAEDAELAGAVCERLAQRWSPPPISADLRALGLRVCSETIYRACYDRTGRRGLPPNSWQLLPRRRRRRKPRGRLEQAKRSALGEFRPLAERPAEAAAWEGDLVIGRPHRLARPATGRATWSSDWWWSPPPISADPGGLWACGCAQPTIYPVRAYDRTGRRGCGQQLACGGLSVGCPADGAQPKAPQPRLARQPAQTVKT